MKKTRNITTQRAKFLCSWLNESVLCPRFYYSIARLNA